MMVRFFFTYGTGGYPFYGGWTVVEAPNRQAAYEAFRAYHPDKTEGLMNCASVYSEEVFMSTEMANTGNFGYRCHEIIRLQHELLSNRKELFP